MFHEDIRNYKNALLIGTGGGNDIVSTIIPALELQEKGIKTDIAGILSPAAIHTFDGKIEDVINNIEGEVKRYISSNPRKEISFIDAKMPQFAKESGLEISDFYDISIRYGTARLIKEFNKFVKEKGYDLIMGVDVGGDILARGMADSLILSPVMDFTTLHLLGNIRTSSYLVEFGLGTDGELRPEGIDAIITKLKNDKIIIHESQISKNDKSINKFREIFDKVKDIRKGHTAVMTLQTLDTKEDIVSEYRYRMNVGPERFYHSFEIVLPGRYSGKTYLMDAKKLYNEREKTAFSYENPLEQYVRLKSLEPKWKTELDMFYLWSDNDWKGMSGQSLFLMIPSTSIPEYKRKNMFHVGEKYFNEQELDMALILSPDRRNIKNQENIIDAGQFSILYKDKTDTVIETAEYIDKIWRSF